MEVGERRGGDEDQMPGTAGIYRLEETEGEERERKRFIPSVGTANLACINYFSSQGTQIAHTWYNIKVKASIAL